MLNQMIYKSNYGGKASITPCFYAFEFGKRLRSSEIARVEMYITEP